jgi:hypothetical protein
MSSGGVKLNRLGARRDARLRGVGERILGFGGAPDGRLLFEDDHLQALPGQHDRCNEAIVAAANDSYIGDSLSHHQVLRRIANLIATTPLAEKDLT